MSKNNETPERGDVLINTTDIGFMTFNRMVRYPEQLLQEDFRNYTPGEWLTFLTNVNTLRKAKYIKLSDDAYAPVWFVLLRVVEFDDPMIDDQNDLNAIRKKMANKSWVKYMGTQNVPFTTVAAIIGTASKKKQSKLQELMVW